MNVQLPSEEFPTDLKPEVVEEPTEKPAKEETITSPTIMERTIEGTATEDELRLGEEQVMFVAKRILEVIRSNTDTTKNMREVNVMGEDDYAIFIRDDAAENPMGISTLRAFSRNYEKAPRISSAGKNRAIIKNGNPITVERQNAEGVWVKVEAQDGQIEIFSTDRIKIKAIGQTLGKDENPKYKVTYTIAFS